MRPKYQNILETVGDTPVVRIGKLAPEGVNLYVKIEAFNPLGSVKDRLALGVIEEAERSGKLKPGQTVNVTRMTGAPAIIPGQVVWVSPPGSNEEGQAGLRYINPLHARIAPR